MEKNEITIDINRLNADELKTLANILYYNGYLKECQEVNKRRVFIEN